jgi:DNA-binding MarR family transcriptional regulator
VTIEDAGTRPQQLRTESTALALVPTQETPSNALAAVQTEHLISDISAALRLLDAVERVRGHAHPLILGLQDAVGMKMPAALVLSAVVNGRGTVQDVADQVGITTGEAELAIADLEALGMVRTTPALAATSLGQARLSQLDALTVRVLDVITGILGPTDAAHLVRLLHAVADGLESTTAAPPAILHN